MSVLTTVLPDVPAAALPTQNEILGEPLTG